MQKAIRSALNVESDKFVLGCIFTAAVLLRVLLFLQKKKKIYIYIIKDSCEANRKRFLLSWQEGTRGG